jgi:hypothetical protein
LTAVRVRFGSQAEELKESLSRALFPNNRKSSVLSGISDAGQE